MSSYAKDLLLTHNITVVLNVKLDTLEGLSRCTGAQIVQSTDDLAYNSTTSHRSSSAGQEHPPNEVKHGIELGVSDFSVATYPLEQGSKTLVRFLRLFLHDLTRASSMGVEFNCLPFPF